MSTVRRVALLLGLSLAAGCAGPRPVLYPNAQLQQAGSETVQGDITACMNYAKQYVHDHPGARVAGRAATSAVVGGATGAVGGAILGRPGTGAAVGAATAATASFMRSLFTINDLSPVERSYTDQCLRERGYQPIGWQ
jgi:hypothetical protein